MATETATIETTTTEPVEVDIVAPFGPARVLQVRTGKIRTLDGIPVESAIYKKPHRGRLKVTTLGFVGDEQAHITHGGPEKALLHYYTGHYSSWKKEIPESAHLFEVGGFGENLVTTGTANERNVCIGDVLKIGEEVVVQVTLPRAPCFKLNHRFEYKNVSRMSQDLRRTGWLYRILREGTIGEGDEVVLIKRMHPRWTVADVQRLLYSDMTNWAEMEELVSTVPELGEEMRNIFLNRLKKRAVEDHSNRLGGPAGVAGVEVKKWKKFSVVERRQETPRICSFVLEAVEPSASPEDVLPGSHVRIKLPKKLIRAYSVVGGTSNRFELGIALSDTSRGGSKYIHDSALVGTTFEFSKISASFPLAEDASNHILVAGGIGITAFIAAAQKLDATGQKYELHYAVSSRCDVAFERYLRPLKNVHVYCKDEGIRLNLKEVFSKAGENAHTYCCGPQRMMDGVASAAKECGWGEDRVHSEAFEATASGDPFTVELAVTNKEIEVEGTQTLLDVLRAAGLYVESSCEVGNCGSCRVPVLKGRIEHRGTGLIEKDKCRAMLSCVSRGIGHIVLDM